MCLSIYFKFWTIGVARPTENGPERSSWKSNIYVKEISWNSNISSEQQPFVSRRGENNDFGPRWFSMTDSRVDSDRHDLHTRPTAEAASHHRRPPVQGRLWDKRRGSGGRPFCTASSALCVTYNIPYSSFLILHGFTHTSLTHTWRVSLWHTHLLWSTRVYNTLEYDDLHPEVWWLKEWGTITYTLMCDDFPRYDNLRPQVGWLKAWGTMTYGLRYDDLRSEVRWF